MADRNTVTLSIMGRDYRLSVTPEEEEKLRVCAQIVEAKMKEIHQPGRVNWASRNVMSLKCLMDTASQIIE